MQPNTSTGRTVRGLVGAAAAVCAVAALVATALPVGAHGDIEDSSPAAGVTVRRAPNRVSLDLAEPPAGGSTLVVTDGCNEEVSGEPTIDDDVLSVAVSEGRPGRWRVRLRSVSSVDGHLVRQNFSFRVRGQRDCSAEETPAGSDETAAEDDEVQLGEPQPPLQNEETSFPFLPFAIGTVAVVGVAIALRRPGRKS